jgi:catechol 2,3-dioxygenase-like lactoylglutathione lyase family enzyme
MRITNPVSRCLPVSDITRSTTFYRDILGFEIKDGPEAILGPARLQFEHQATTPVIIFFQTDDISAFRAAILARGGSAGEIQRVNWIKMQMFELRDPDSNILWFGQTFHVDQDSPSLRSGQPKGIRQALPELPCDNITAAVQYYCDVLGFRINYQQDDLGVLDRDAITILLIPRTDQHKGIGSFGTYVEDAHALYAELSSKGAQTQGEPVSYPWGLRTFSVLDLEGNRITFAQTFE